MRNSKLILAQGIKLDRNYNNVLSYSEEQLLDTILNQYSIYEGYDYSFIDEMQNSICVQIPYGNCINVNYLAFQNTRYNNKWFFCFVDKIEYNSEKSTNIFFHTDEWSTWFKDSEKLPCYVLREHVLNDMIGINTIDEGLDTGETIAVDTTEDNNLANLQYIAVASNWNPQTKSGYNGVNIYTRLAWGSVLYLFNFELVGIGKLQNFIRQTNYDGHIADIKDIFFIPQNLINENHVATSPDYDITDGQTVFGTSNFKYIDTNTFTSHSEDFSVNKHLSFGNITIRNNKCFCYPYNYLLVTNNVGTKNVLRYEDFSTAACVFSNQYAMTIGCSARTVPKNYKGIAENIDESVTLAKFPTCQWSSDSYTNWLTQNAINIEKQQVNIGYTGVKAATGFIGNLLSGNLGGALTSGIDSAQSLQNQIMDLQGGFYQAKLLPNLVGGSADGDVNFASTDNVFKYVAMQCKPEYIKMIDSYFDKFGYKILRIKIPEFNSRRNWNYLQIGAGETFVSGDIPQKAQETINAICQKGVTIWHNNNSIGNYNLENDVVG